jgi:type II secretory pathway predicted ATPase ExeA
VERGKIMYLNFYGMNEKPFTLTPDTKFLYLSKNHQDALNHFVYGIREEEWFMVLTGDIGTGKTTIVRALLERLDKDTSSALILDPLLEGEDLLRATLEDFGIGSPGGTRKELIGRLNQFLLGELMHGRKAVLIIDEAQHISDQALEEIRLLSNIETERAKLLQIILVGQAELHRKLESPLLRPLNQRISIRYHLQPLSRVDTEKYIRHRLLVAGSNGHISFSDGALYEIFKYSQGIPRLINLVCDRTLLAGYTKHTNYLDKGIVKKGAESLRKQGATPFTIPSKGRRLLFLGVSALFLGCAFLVGFQGEDLYVKSVKFWHSLRGHLPVIEQHPVTTPKGGIEFTAASPYDSNSPSMGMETQGFGHHYGIHISSYRDKRRALMDVNQLRKLGYQAFTVKEDIPGKGIWYRVMFGKFRTRDEAQTMVKKIKAFKAFSDARIIRSK